MWDWFILTKTQKEKYFESLDPKGFNAVQLATSFASYQKEAQDKAIQELSEKLPKEKFEMLMQNNATMEASDDFPERGKAMLEGITVIHEYLKLVDDRKVVLLHIG